MIQWVLQKRKLMQEKSVRRSLGVQRKIITRKLKDIEDREHKVYIQIIGVQGKENYTEQK